ncbi:MAG: DNA primase [Clostridiales bacterium]|nr:DNA primase [Clostridiales bacterium]
MFYPRDVTEEVRSGNEIVSVVSSYVRLKQSGSYHRGLCPFHNEKTPSFYVMPDKQTFRCYGCGAGGSVLSFIMQIENLKFPEAVEFLAERIHYKLPERGVNDETVRQREIIYEMNKKAARFFYNCLQAEPGSTALAYFNKREVSPETRVKFGLGYAPGHKATVKFLREQGYSEKNLEISGLVIRDKYGGFYDRFSERLMFPIFDVSKRVVGFGGRALNDAGPKYLNSPDTQVFDKSRNLYGIQLAKQSKARDLILVEGYMDVITLFQAGFTNTVAALGTALNQHHARAIKKYRDNVTVLFDSDEAGTKAALRAIPVLLSCGLHINILQVTDAKDPDEYIKKFGGVAFKQLLNTSSDHITFQLAQLKKTFHFNKGDFENISERVRFTTESAKIISKADSAIERDAYAKELSGVTGIAADAINTEINKIINRPAGNRPPGNRPGNHPGNHPGNRVRSAREKSTPQKGVSDAKKGLIYFAATDERVCNELIRVLKPEELVEDVYVKLLTMIFDYRKNGLEFSSASLINDFEELSDHKLISSIFDQTVEYHDATLREKAINDMLKVIKNSFIDTEFHTADFKRMNELKGIRENIKKLYISI